MKQISQAMLMWSGEHKGWMVGRAGGSLVGINSDGKPNGTATPSLMKGDSPLFLFVILTFLVPTKIQQVNTLRSFQLLS